MIARNPPEQRSALGRRKGITIIETIVLMTGVAAMLGLCVLLLQFLLKLDGQSRARLDGASALARLARQFRQDVHAAGRASLVDHSAARPSELRIESGKDRIVAYEVKGDAAVVRVETLKGAQVRRESYEIPRSGSIQLAVKKLGGQSFASLTSNHLVSKIPSDPPRLFEVIALVGKNRDWAGGKAAAVGGTP